MLSAHNSKAVAPRQPSRLSYSMMLFLGCAMIIDPAIHRGQCRMMSNTNAMSWSVAMEYTLRQSKGNYIFLSQSGQQQRVRKACSHRYPISLNEIRFHPSSCIIVRVYRKIS